MSRRQWLGSLGALLAVIAIGIVLMRAAGREGPSPTPAAAGACTARPEARADASAAASWSLVDRTDPGGSLVGRSLHVGGSGGGARTLELDNESMAGAPVGGVIVAASDNGTASTVLLIDAAAGCFWPAHTTTDVVRSTLLNVEDGAILVHTVARATRADLGIWSLIPDTAAAIRAMAPLAPRPAIGPIGSTEMRLDPTGSLLAVGSCAEFGCVARVATLEDALAPAILLENPELGGIIGFTGESLVTWQWCVGFPCPIQAWEPATGSKVTLVPGAVAAAMTGDGRTLLAVVDPGTARAIRVDLAGHQVQPISGLLQGELPLGSGLAAYAGLEVAADEVAVGVPGEPPRAFNPSEARPVP